MFNEWGDNLNGLGAYAPSYPGDPGRGVDLGGRLIGKGGIILPAPPANCPADYRAKYIRTFGVDPGCTPLVVNPTPYTPPAPTGPGTNNPYPVPVPVTPVVETPPYVAPAGPASPSMPSIPVSPVTAMPAPRTRHRPAHRHVRPGDQEICPSYGHVNRQIPGVNEYQVVACTPGQPVQINRGLRRVVRQEALARHPSGGRERQGQAGDYQGGGGVLRGSTSSGSAVGASSMGAAVGGSICLPSWSILAALAAAFFFMKR